MSSVSSDLPDSPVPLLLQVYGHWVLVWSVSDMLGNISLLAQITSSHAELQLLPDNSTVRFNEMNLLQ